MQQRKTKQEWRLLCQDFDAQASRTTDEGQKKYTRRCYIRDHPDLDLTMESAFSKNYKRFLEGKLNNPLEETRRPRKRQHLDAEEAYVQMFREQGGVPTCASKEAMRQKLIERFSVPGKQFKASATWCKHVELRYSLHKTSVTSSDEDSDTGFEIDDSDSVSDDEGSADARMFLSVDYDEGQFKTDLAFEQTSTSNERCVLSTRTLDPFDLGARSEEPSHQRSDCLPLPASISFSDPSTSPACSIDNASDPDLLEAEAARLQERSHNALRVLQLLRKALALRLDSDDEVCNTEVAVVESYKKIGSLQFTHGDLVGALTTYHEAFQFRLKAWRSLKENIESAEYKAWLVETEMGWDAALVFHTETATLLERWKMHPLGNTEILNSIGYVYRAQGNFEQARQYFLQSLTIIHNKAPGSEAEAENYKLLGEVQRCQNNLQGAAISFQRAADINIKLRRRMQATTMFTCPFSDKEEDIVEELPITYAPFANHMHQIES